MSLNQFAADCRLAIYQDLLAGREPSRGRFDPASLRRARDLGAPQMGVTRYEPGCISFEFIYSVQSASAHLLVVEVEPPERIVFLPVPGWVVENVWQGDVAGSYHFESDARRLVEDFAAELEPGPNAKWFGPQAPKRRE